MKGLKKYMKKKFCVEEMQVRSYECDFQGIVNNAVYMNYLEHARMQCGKRAGIDVAAMADEGVFWIVSEARLQYKSSLHLGDEFKVITSASMQGVMRCIFHQEIRKKNTDETVMQAEITTACIAGGKPIPLPASIREKMIFDN